MAASVAPGWVGDVDKTHKTTKALTGPHGIKAVGVLARVKERRRLVEEIDGKIVLAFVSLPLWQGRAYRN